MEFLNYWLKNNYGYMSKCYAPMLQMKPIDVKERFQHWQLLAYELLEINDITPFTTDVKVRVKLKMADNDSTAIYEFRLIVNNAEGDLAYISSDDTVWGITTWRTAQ